PDMPEAAHSELQPTMVVTGATASSPSEMANGDLTGFEQRLQVGEDERPAFRQSSDEPGLRQFDFVSARELHRAVHGLEREGAATRTLGLELGLPLALPTDDHATRRINFEDLARVRQASVPAGLSPGRALLPAALDDRVEPVTSDELRVRQGLPELVGRGADDRDVDEAASIRRAHGACVVAVDHRDN